MGSRILVGAGDVTMRLVADRIYSYGFHYYNLLKNCPMTRLSLAASTTALVTSRSSLISRIRSIRVSRRFSNRKLPPVIRIMAATGASQFRAQRPAEPCPPAG